MFFTLHNFFISVTNFKLRKHLYISTLEKGKMASPVISVTNEREIQPFQLSIEQLSALKTQHEEELQELQKQMESLYDANSR